MIQQQKLFENFFEDPKITTTRLANFAGDTLNRLTSANGGGSYTSLINQLNDPLETLNNELGQVDTGVTVQKGATLTNNQVLEQFKQTMSNEEPFIARALGGNNTAAYLQFYPQGLAEYHRATKTNMTTLTNRVNVAADNFATELGSTLSATLMAFEEDWQDSRNSQQQRIGNVDSNRSERTAARTDVELALVYCVHSIAALFPGNEEQCGSFFDFSMLLPQTRRHHETLNGTLAANQVTTVVNRTFMDTVNLTLRNPDDNSPIVFWLAADGEEDTPPAEAVEVQPGHAVNTKPSILGPLENTFLQVKNLSAVNEGAYEVVIA